MTGKLTCYVMQRLSDGGMTPEIAQKILAECPNQTDRNEIYARLMVENGVSPDQDWLRALEAAIQAVAHRRTLH